MSIMLLKDLSLKSRLILLLVATLVIAAVYFLSLWGDVPPRDDIPVTAQPTR